MRRIWTVVSAAVVLAGTLSIVWPMAALGHNGDRIEYDLTFDGVVDCGSFVDNFTDFYHVRETDEYDADGNLERAFEHITHTSNDVNSVTGFTIHEHGRFYEVDDYVNGTFTLTGVQQLANRQGTGVVIQDTGRLVLDGNFSLVFFAGGRHHSNVVQGEVIYCDALS